MIEGSITGRFEAQIEITVDLPSGDVALVDAVIDTGYDGTLVLPRQFLEDYGLASEGTRPVMLADGTIDNWPRYDVVLLWHDARIHVDVLASEGEILIGTRLLRGSRLVIEFTEGGTVEIHTLQ